ncbi:MAG: hypothetical protein MUC53_00990 [Candidatus Contendobacter sp.]|jgi:hypothetical protein|nr:hypothetical protein [Candidatus Contendobacter sp.]
MTARARFPKTAVAAALKKLGADPFAELVTLARRTDDDVIAARIWLDLAQYVAPKLKALEISGPDRGPLQMELRLQWPD